jgi:hypothetical protein
MNKRLPVTGVEPIAEIQKARTEDFPPPEAYEFEDMHVPVDGQRISDASFVFGGGHRSVGSAAIETTVIHAVAAKPPGPFVRSKDSASQTKKSRKVRIIDEQEESSMVSCWTIYLCLQRGESERFKIFNGRWSDFLGEKEEYPYNEETEEFELPDEINGVKVEAVDDEMILGGDLIWETPTDLVEFNETGSQELRNWLKKNNWDFEAIKVKLSREMQSLGAKQASRAPKKSSSRRREKK